MENEVKSTEEVAENVDAQQEELKEVAPAQDDIDYQAQLDALKAENERLARDRDNYREGMLSKEKKLKSLRQEDDWTSEEEKPADEDKVRAIIKEELTNSKLLENERKQQELIEKMAQDLKEAKLALRNKAQVQNKIGGGSDEDYTPSDEYFSEAQLRELQARGIDTSNKELMATLKKNMRETTGSPMSSRKA